MRYWVVRGAIRGGDQEIPFAWSDVAVAHQDGPIEPRLLEAPSSFEVGPADVVGETPPSITTTLVVDNGDGALDAYLTGGDRGAGEYRGPSLYAVEAAIFEGHVQADGTCLEHRWTPTMVLGGAFAQTDGQVTIPMTSDDARLLGPSSKVLTVGQLRQAEVLQVSADGVPPGAPTNALRHWTALRSQWDESDDSVVPWAYGSATIPLIPVQTADRGLSLQWVAFTSTESGLYHWKFLGRVGDVIREYKPSYRSQLYTYRAKLRVRDEKGRAFECWVETVEAYFHTGVPTWSDGEEEEWPDQIWMVPEVSPVTSLPGMQDWGPDWHGLPFTPIDVLKSILQDHSERGAAAWDAASFQAVADATRHLHGVTGGLVRDATTIGELIPYICQPAGIATWIGPDDRLHAALGGSWTTEDAELVAGPLPLLLDGDIFPSGGADGPSTWEETGPADPEDPGAPASLWSIDWAADQEELYPDRLRRVRALSPLRPDSEVRIPGTWIHPPAAALLLDQASSARAYATRHVTAVTHIALAREIGAMCRAYHGSGLGYEGAPLRMRRATIMPAEDAARIQWEDCTALEAMKVGILDDGRHWLAVNNAGVTLRLRAGETTATLSTPLRDNVPPGSELWVWGVYPWACGVSGMAGTDMLILDAAAPITTQILQVEPPIGQAQGGVDPHRARWVLMKTATSAGHAYRPDRIRLCEDPTGVFPDGVLGFQFTGGAGRSD